MLDDVRGVRHDAGYQYLSGRQLDALPDFVLVLVPRIGALDQVSLRLDAQQEIDDLLELDIVCVRAMPASPAEVVAHTVLGHIAQRVVERLDAQRAPLAEGLEAHRDADAVPERHQPRVIDLQHDLRSGDRFILDAHRFGDAVDEFLLAAVILVAPVDLEARRRRRRQEGILRRHMRLQLGDLALERRASGVGDRPGANPDGTQALDLLARCVEERALLAGIAIELGERLAVPALCDERHGARLGRARLEAAEARLDIGKPVATLGVLAFVDQVEPEVALLLHHVGDAATLDLREASHVRRQDPVAASLHATSVFGMVRLP